jgi:hypothetical protein
MLSPTKSPVRLSPQTIADLNTVIISLTRRIIQTVSLLVCSRTRDSKSNGPVSVLEVRAALDILNLPRSFEKHFATLPGRLHSMGVTFIGNTSDFYKIYGRGEKVTTHDVAEHLLSGKQRGRARTLFQWPAEWDINHGFDWETIPIDQSSPTDDGSESDSEIGSPNDPEELEISHISEDDQDRTSPPPPPPAHWYRKSSMIDDDGALLEKETAYLDDLDAQRGQIEQNRLNRRIKEGTAFAQRCYRDEMKSFKLSEQTRASRKSWTKARRRYTATFGDDWGSYDRDVVSIEGEGWEGPSERWEMFRKKEPPPAASGNDRVLRKRNADVDIGYPNKKRKHKRQSSSGSEEEEEEFQGDEFSDSD